MPYKFVYKYGHVEIYINGKFYCTADNEDEALREIEEYEDMHACVQI